MKLHFDLTQDATRQHILDTLLDAMDAHQNDRFNEILELTTVPDKHHHNVVEVYETIDGLNVPEQIKEDLHGIYGILAAAEAEVHGCEINQTHFHEVGNASGIRNALAICAAEFVLEPEEITATAIQTGEGEVECAHGTMSIPAPATAAILRGLPLADQKFPGERCTPTSAAVIKHFVARFV